MPAQTQAACQALLRLFSRVPIAKGVYVEGDKNRVFVGRKGKGKRSAKDHRMRLNGLGEGVFVLHARLAGGAWAFTGQVGTLPELVKFMTSAMPHYLRAWPSDAPGRTSGARY